MPIIILSGIVREKATQQAWPNLRIELVLAQNPSNIFASTHTDNQGRFKIEVDTDKLPNQQDDPHKLPVRFRFSQEEYQFLTPSRTFASWKAKEPLDFDLEASDPLDEPEDSKDLNTFSVQGVILRGDGTRINNITVEAFDKGVGEELSLGRISTDKEGSYFISYTAADLCPGKERADLIVRVFERGKEIATSPLIINAREEERINLSVARTGFRGPSEFAVLSQTLAPSLEGKEIQKLNSRDVKILKGKHELEESSIAYYIKAIKHGQELNLSPEWFYGMYRTGLSTSLNYLLSQQTRTLGKAIAASAKRNIIDPAIEKDAVVYAEQIKAEGAQRTLASNPKISELMEMAGLNTNHQENFVAYIRDQNPTNSIEFWRNLREEGVLPSLQVEQLEEVSLLATIALNHLPLVRVLQKRASLAASRALDLVSLTEEDWVGIIQAENTGVPEGIPGNDMDAQYKAYANVLTRLTQDAYPTATFANSWAIGNGNDDFGTFFTNNPTFSYQAEPVSSFLAHTPNALVGISDPEAFTLQLKSSQVLFTLAPAYGKADLISPLIQDNLLSSHNIALMGETAFLNAYATDDTYAAYQSLYANAVKMADTSLLVILDYIDRYGSLPAYVFPDLAVTKSEAGIPEWSNLFGSLDFCECKHCYSVLSPAAYLVDLLVYLNGTLGSNGETGMQKLFTRRPDIANLDLTCENSLTSLPYIDLVNEVLENAIIPLTYTKRNVEGIELPESDEVPQTNGEEEALKAQPEHLNPAAYEVLIQAKYPWNLPFHLWQEETHVYLDHMGVPRHQLVELLHPNNHNDKPWALSYLNLFPEVWTLISTSDPSPISLSLNWSKDPQSIIQGSLDNFMALADLTYEEVKQLIQCRFINSSGSLSLALLDCSLEASSLDGLTLKHLDRIHRFERLRGRLGWSIYDLDRAINAFNAQELNDELLIHLAFTQYIYTHFPGLNLSELLSWWGSIVDTWEYTENVTSLYVQVFLNPGINDLDQVVAGSTIREIFALNSTFTELEEVDSGNSRNIRDEGILSLCLAALNLTESDFDLLLGPVLANDTLNLENLSRLFRCSSFIQFTNLSVPEYLSLVALIGPINGLFPLGSPADSPSPPTLGDTRATRAYLEVLADLEEAKVDIAELDYLLRHLHDNTSSVAIEESGLATLTEELHQALKDIRDTYTLSPTAEYLTTVENTLNLLLIGSDSETAEEQVQRAMRIIYGTTDSNDPDEGNLDFLMPFLIDVSLIEQVIADAQDPVQNVDSTEIAKALLEQFFFFLKESYMASYLNQRLATEFEVSEPVMDALLGVHIYNPSDSSQVLLDMFRGDPFVTNEAEITYDNFTSEFLGLELLYKISVIIRQVGIPDSDLTPVFSQWDSYGFPNLKSLPLQEGDNPISFNSWHLLWKIYQLYQQRYSTEESILTVLDLGQNNDILGIASTLESQWNWRRSDVEYLLGPEAGLQLDLSADASWLEVVDMAFDLSEKTGVSITQLQTWTEDSLNESHALIARNAVKAQYNLEEWLKIAQSLRDPIREQQRDALEAYVIQLLNFSDTEDLYAHYLIDTQTNACMMTSRIILAISSIQLFIQRIRMNLEQELAIEFSAEDRDEWIWRKNYRVWEANRKVFLWPENWIEPELRSDKSIFFEELEDDLLQAEVTEETVEQAYMNYLRSLDSVSNLEISAPFYDRERDILHVVGRTLGTPHVYYYRQWIHGSYWTNWERLELDIQGDHVALYVFRHRLYVFWVNWQEQEGVWATHLYWSEYQDGQWTPSKTSKGKISSYSPSGPSNYIIQPALEGEDLVVVAFTFQSVLRHGGYFAHFKLSDCQGDFIPREEIGTGPGFSGILPAPELDMRYMYYESNTFNGAPEALPLTLATNETSSQDTEEIVLNSEFVYRVHPPAADFDSPFYSSPFFLSANGRSYLVTSFDRLTWRAGEEEGVSTGPNFEMGSADLGWLDEGVTRYFPELEIPKFDDGPQEEIGPIPGGHTSNDGLLVYDGNLGANTTVIREDNGIDQVLVSSPSIGGLQTPSMQVGKRIASGTLTTENAQILTDSVDKLLSEEGETGWHSLVATADQGFQFYRFYHPYTCLFIEQLNRYGIEGVLAPTASQGPEAGNLIRQKNYKDDFDSIFQPTEVVGTPYPVENIEFTMGGVYSEYNWELFFHGPLLIATRLMQNQQFEQAQQWFHYIFDPTRMEGEAPQRFWMFKPFYDYADEAQTDSLYQLLSEESTDLNAQIEAMEGDPFNPHILARIRTVAYMKTVVMKYLDNLLAWGDSLFRQDSIESINEATQLFVLATQILGRKPVQIEKEEPDAYTFNDLFEKDLFGLSNALIDIEAELSITNSQDTSNNGSSILYTMLYFCIPHNEKLLGYWDTVADRLFKIRNCLNIEGIKRSLTLLQPPIDPAQLVRAAAAGVDIGSVLQDLNAPLPFYRFRYIIQKANEFCGDVKALGGAVLAALEKKDAEELALLRSGQEVELLKSIQGLKEQAIDEAEETLEGLKKSREAVELRRSFYENREFRSKQELKQLDKLKEAQKQEKKAQNIQQKTNLTALLGDITIGFSGVSPVSEVKYGGTHLAAAGNAWASHHSKLASKNQFQERKLANKGSLKRRDEEWNHQIELAIKEIEEIDQHILAAEIRLEMAKQDLQNQELQIKQSQEIADFMEQKYTQKDLYNWMTTQISGLYFQVYNLAYDMAKRAERCFRQELAIEDSNYIQFGYFDSLKKGLLAGERLQKDLRRLETAYLEQNVREYELTKHISLRRLDPEALLELKATGSCEISLPEWLFDLDTPGHYLRRIKQVSLTIPTIAGPFTQIPCTLSLLKSSTRTSNILGNGYPRDEAGDDRFTDYYGAIPSIVTSHAQNDSGMFEMNLQDERFLPFEFSGVISNWRVELPAELRQFNYEHISDVILHLRYTSRSGGEVLSREVSNAVKTLLPSEGIQYQLFSLTQDFPTEWYRAQSEVIPFESIIRKDHFPYLAQGFQLEVTEIQVWEIVGDQLTSLSDVLILPSGGLDEFNTSLEAESGALLSVELSNVNPEGKLFVIMPFNLK
ncbi:MAG: neuraminidase-like domain-containing protein [Bacteroidota bacterium]